ncbi:MAG: hypothetical protein KGI27_02270 [Thaumarchaeota archaeon]|nr:hypothetical protein [Nitrososphaerota archaeon]
MITQVDNWQYFLRQIPQAEQIHKNAKQRIDDIISKFEEIFGKGWWQYAAEHQHPLFWNLHHTLWDPDYHRLDELATSLNKLKRILGFDSLRQRARSAEQFESVETEIMLGTRIMEKCPDISFDQPIGNKRPDIICTFENQILLLEVKTLLTAQETQKARKTEQEILQSCLGIFPFGRIFKVLSEPHLEDIKKEVEIIAREAIEQQIPKVVNIPKILKLLLIPDSIPDRPNIIKQYRDNPVFFDGSMSGQTSGLHGPDDGVRSEHRIRIRLQQIKNEQQIPQDRTGVIILSSKDFFFMDDQVVSGLVDSIIESVYELRNIAAVVLYNNVVVLGETQPRKAENDDYIVLERTLSDSSQEYMVIIKNKYCKFDFDYDLLVRLLSV